MQIAEFSLGIGKFLACAQDAVRNVQCTLFFDKRFEDSNRFHDLTTCERHNCPIVPTPDRADWITSSNGYLQCAHDEFLRLVDFTAIQLDKTQTAQGIGQLHLVSELVMQRQCLLQVLFRDGVIAGR